jgi:uncharacterized protein (TIGR03067 family)
MRVRRALLAALAGLLAAADGAGDRAAAELKKLDGNWVVKALTVDGREAPEGVIAGWRMTVKDGRYSLLQGDKEQAAGVFRVHPDKRPPWIDAKITAGPDKGKNEVGVYELEGDRLRTCFAKSTRYRPAELVSPEGSGLELASFERQK